MFGLGLPSISGVSTVDSPQPNVVASSDVISPVSNRTMKPRYIIAAIIVVALAAAAWFALDASSIEYADIERAERLGKTVQVVGSWIKEDGMKYDETANTFSFAMKDEHGKRVPVVLNGAKPNNFEMATSIVVKGRMENGTFQASHILTKCPSKYEGQPADAHPEA